MSIVATVVRGTVTKDGTPTEGAYVRVLGPSGEFVNERRTGPDGGFTLHLTQATWTFIAFAPGTNRIEQAVTIEGGPEAAITLDLSTTQ
ncbi:MAG TPA: DUF1416 domain-containing protein [Actinomycetota bacterium]|nr:DUF1416 domain-containing protein [Actinomycetota bacterium]